jgi:deazaflavin-dependent oxidoreductase (nitroreductase family)
MKRRVVRRLQKHLLDPPIRLLLALGVAPPGYALLETIGRASGTRRRTPVGNGLVGDTFWLIAEHGRQAGFVRNLERDPQVRVKVRHGVRYGWRTGIAHVWVDDDPRARQRSLSRGHPIRLITAWAVRVMGTDLLTIRIDLDPN